MTRTAPALLLLAALAGCAFTSRDGAPADKLAQSEAAYTTVASTLLDLRRAGKVNDDDWKAVKEINEAVDEGFEAAHVLIDNGDTAGADDVLGGLRVLVERLKTYRAEAQRGH